MNKVVRERYPLERLPEELRPMSASDEVRVTVEPTGHRPQPLPLDRLWALRKSVQASMPRDDDPVARIRALRNEWD